MGVQNGEGRLFRTPLNVGVQNGPCAIVVASMSLLIQAVGIEIQCPFFAMSTFLPSWQILSLFAYFPPSLHVLGMVWKADFVAICVVPALLTCLGNGLEGRFCRYLRSSRSLYMSWEYLGRQILSLFA